MLRTFDAHVHRYDRDANTHPFLEHEDARFKRIVGDHSALPRRYTAEAYQRDSASCQVEGIVGYEFIGDDAAREAQWAQQEREASTLAQALVVRVDFLDPALARRLQAYTALPGGGGGARAPGLGCRAPDAQLRQPHADCRPVRRIRRAVCGLCADRRRLQRE